MSDQPSENSEFDEEFNPEYSSSLFLEIIDEQEVVAIEETRIRSVCEKILLDAGIVSGRIGIVIVDNETIHKLNADFLQHDYPTDVISFQVESELERGYLEGEVIASAEMAKDRAPEFAWSVKEELILYIIHGLLHLVGFDDLTDTDRKTIREKERYYLRYAGFEPNDLGFDPEPEETADDSEPETLTHVEESGSLFPRLHDGEAEKN